MRLLAIFGGLLAIAATSLIAQTYQIVPAAATSMPAHTVDGNSPAFRDENGILHVYTSTGAEPMRMSGAGVLELSNDAVGPSVEPGNHYPIWIESIWRDVDGTVYGWYHHEPAAQSVCPGRKLTAPEIGAVVSLDGGVSFTDLGLVLTSGDQPNCSAQNGFFAGGNGDFSVIPDRDRQFFYFLFTNYGGSAAHQGIAIARMAFADRANPAGAVYKYFLGEWSEPGLGGMVTPVFPATTSWDQSNTDSFWGAAVHWNTAIESYAVVMNRACCKTNWPQEGIYISFNPDLAHPESFTHPAKLIDASAIGFAPGYYPQVFGLGEGETDSLAGKETRLYVKGTSKWRVIFGEDPESEPLPSVPPPPEECQAADCPEVNPDTGALSAPRSSTSPLRSPQSARRITAK